MTGRSVSRWTATGDDGHALRTATPSPTGSHAWKLVAARQSVSSARRSSASRAITPACVCATSAVTAPQVKCVLCP